ncbi:hypothetical protein BGZ76_002183, partial [Entomortierella beljakovae]
LAAAGNNIFTLASSSNGSSSSNNNSASDTISTSAPDHTPFPIPSLASTSNLDNDVTSNNTRASTSNSSLTGDFSDEENNKADRSEGFDAQSGKSKKGNDCPPTSPPKNRTGFRGAEDDDNRIATPIIINSQEFTALLDPGASMSFIDRDVADYLQISSTLEKDTSIAAIIR